MEKYVGTFLYGLMLAGGLETAILFLLLRFCFGYTKERISTGTLIFVGVLASTATLPYLWFVLPAFIHSRLQLIVYGEIGVTIFESLVYLYCLELKWQQALFLSVICNLSSMIAGLFLIK
jgi:hypothetical protein